MSISEDMLRKMQADDTRLRQTETKEVPIYTTGTWTPTLVGLTIAGTFTYAATTAGNYTRIGNTVFLRGRINITTVTVAPTGNLTIQGLPITPATVTSGAAGGAQFSYWSLVGLGGGANVHLAGWIQSAATNRIELLVSQNAGGAAAFLTGAVAALVNGSDMSFQGQYQV